MTKVSEDAAAVNPVAMFLEAQTDFWDEASRLSNDLLDIAKFRQELNDLNAEFKEVEAQVLLIGEVEGKNETQRKAALTLLMRDDPKAKSLRSHISKKQADMDTASADLELARLRISSAKARRNMALVVLGYLTAAQGDRWAMIDGALATIQEGIATARGQAVEG